MRSEQSFRTTPTPKLKPNMRIAYFLGNLPEHWLHAEALYEKLPGDVVVFSEATRAELLPRGVDAVAFDEDPNAKLKIERRRHANTLARLHDSYDVVFFFDVYVVPSRSSVGGAWWVQLGHGVVVKDDYYMFATPRHTALMRHYDIIASMGPYTKAIQQKKGLPSSRLVKLGVARSDISAKSSDRVELVQEAMVQAGLNPSLKTVVYMPTFYGITSINTLPEVLAEAVPMDVNLVFRPHPETPTTLVKKALKDLDGRKFFHYSGPGAMSPLWEITYCYQAADVIIGDMSSAFFEGGVAGSRLVFVSDEQGLKTYRKRMARLFKNSIAQPPVFDGNNIEALKNEVKRSLALGRNDSQKESLTAALFWEYGHAIDEIVAHVRSLPEQRVAARLTAKDLMVLGVSTAGIIGRSSLRPVKLALFSLLRKG